jgi:hypothetical protein
LFRLSKIEKMASKRKLDAAFTPAERAAAEVMANPQKAQAVEVLRGLKNKADFEDWTEKDDAKLVSAFDGVKGGRRRRMRGGAGEEEAARQAYQASKAAFGGFIASIRTLIGKVVADNLFTIAGTSAALSTNVGTMAVTKIAGYAGLAAPYAIGATAGLMMVLAVYRTVRTAIIITAQEAATAKDAVKGTALVQDLGALDKMAADAIADPDPMKAARTILADAKMKAAIQAALNSKAAGKDFPELVQHAKRVTRAAKAAEDAAAAAAANPADAAAAAEPAPGDVPPPDPAAAAALDDAMQAQPEAPGEEEDGMGGQGAMRGRPGMPAPSPIVVRGGRRLTSRRRRRAAYLPRQTRRSSSGRRRGYSRRRRE